MKDSLLTTLRDRETSQHEFRVAADKLTEILAAEMASELSLEPIALLAILRSGIALLPPFLRLFNDAKVGFLGIKRDESTAKPFQYYENIPPLSKNSTVLILEPMIATGGTALLALKKLAQHKIDLSRVFFIGFIASTEGLAAIREEFPQVQIKVVAEDKQLNAHKYIIPGLGDFGDRYFG